MRSVIDLSETELRDLMSKCGTIIHELFDSLNIEKPLFTLILMNDPRTCQYISNCHRPDTIAAIRQVADSLNTMNKEKHKDV